MKVEALQLARHASAAQALGRMAGVIGAPSEKAVGTEAALAAFLSGSGMGPELAASLTEPVSAYQQSLWLNRCIDAVATSAKGVPVRFLRASADVQVEPRSKGLSIRRSKGRSLRPVRGAKAVCVGRAAENEELVSGPAQDLFARPNAYQDWPAFFEATVGFLLLHGSVAWILADMTGNRPASMHCVGGRRIEPVVDRDARGLPVLSGYWYTPSGGHRIALAPDEVKFFRLWAGSDNPLEGLAKTRPGRLAIATDYSAALYNAAMLSNSAEPGMTIEFLGNLTPEQRAQFNQALLARHQGPARAKLPLILEGGGKAAPWQTSMAELQFDQGKKTTRLEICCLVGVPPVVAGWVDAAGDSSAYTSNALQQFWQQTMFPLLDGFAPAIQDLVGRFDPRAASYFDVEDLPVVQTMRLARLEAGQKLWSMGVPLADVDAMLDLGVPDQPWHAMGYLPSGLLPASDVATGGGFSPAPEGVAPEELGARNHVNRDLGPWTLDLGQKEVRDRIWQAWARSWAPLAQKLRSVLRVHLVEQERAALAALKDEAKVQGLKSKVDEKASLDRLLVQVFDDARRREKFRVRIQAALKDGQELGLRQALSEAGLAGDALQEAVRRLTSNPAILDALKREAVTFSKLIDDRTRRMLRETFAEGLAAGEDARHLADRVQALMGVRRGHAMAIARNAVGQVLSEARHAGHLASGMTHKVWLHSRGPGKRRPGHVEAEARYAADPCPIDEPFELAADDGGLARLMYPRQFGVGADGECYGCQCLQIARRIGTDANPSRDRKGAGDADLGPWTLDFGPFVSYGEMCMARTGGGREHGEKDEA